MYVFLNVNPPSETLEPVIDSAQLEETLSAQPHFERLQGLSIVTKPAK